MNSDGRYDAKPLVECAGGFRFLAQHLKKSGTSMRTLIDAGLTVDQAEDYANKLGVHPVELWPEWFDDHLADDDAPPPHQQAAS